MTQPRRKMSTFVFLQKGMWHELILFSLLMPLLPKHTAVSQITRGLKLSIRSYFQRWCGFQKGLTVLNFGFFFFFVIWFVFWIKDLVKERTYQYILIKRWPTKINAFSSKKERLNIRQLLQYEQVESSRVMIAYNNG